MWLNIYFLFLYKNINLSRKLELIKKKKKKKNIIYNIKKIKKFKKLLFYIRKTNYYYFDLFFNINIFYKSSS